MQLLSSLFHSSIYKKSVLISKFVLILLTILALVKTIFISLDIDESYAIALAYRLAVGDRLLAQLWESHQFSGLFLSLFIKLFLCVTGGNTSYLVITCRILGTCIHLLFAYFIYLVFRNHLSKNSLFLFILLHINFLPKWVQTPEFELQHYWCVLGIFLMLFYLYSNERFFQTVWHRYSILSFCGILIVFSMMQYPTMLLLYPGYVIGIFLTDKKQRNASSASAFTSCLMLTLGALFSGLLFLGYLFSYQSIPEFIHNVYGIFMDESHTEQSLSLRLLLCSDELWRAAIIPFTEFILILTITHFGLKKWYHTLVDQITFALIFVLFLQEIQQILGCLFFNSNQFYLQLRFLLICITGFTFYITYAKNKNLIYLILEFACIPGLLSLLAVIFITNMNLSVSSAKMYLAVFGSLLIMEITFTENYSSDTSRDSDKKYTDKIMNLFYQAFVVITLLGFIVCKLILIRVSGCFPVTIIAPLTRITNGPAKGIWMLEDQADVFNTNYEFIREHVSKEDKLFYIGCENLYYLFSDAEIATPSTQGTPAFNEMYPTYFEERPEKYPTVIVVDKLLGDRDYYYKSDRNTVTMNWMQEEGFSIVEEGDYLTIYRR